MEGAPLFDRWCGTGERSPAHTVAHGKHSPRGGRSLHSDPWREGGRADEEAEAAASTTGVAQCARDSDSGSNNAKAVRVETGTVTQHCTGDVQQPVGHRTWSTHMTVHSHVPAWMRRERP